jgi:uncharacterized membrane-anchored protein YitT (DUF2179 family)
MKRKFLNSAGDIVLLIVGVMSAAFGLKSFLVPNHFLDGGIFGISLLLHAWCGIPVTVFLLLLNLPFFVAGIYSINKRFAIWSSLALLLLIISILVIPFPNITSDKLLTALFGGVFIGIGNGLTMRVGCALDGIELLALYVFRKTGFSLSEVVLAINLLIFAIGSLLLGVDTALYAALTYFVVTHVSNYVAEGFEAFVGVTIVSRAHQAIRVRLVEQMRKGITVHKGERGYLPANKHTIPFHTDILFVVVSRLELRKLKMMVQEEDPAAFIYSIPIKDASGGVLRKRTFDHSANKTYHANRDIGQVPTFTRRSIAAK